MFQALGAVGGPTLALRYNMAKKAELAATCERIFSGDYILEAEVKQAALAWVPEIMRFKAPEPISVRSESSATDADPARVIEQEQESEPDREAA